MNMDTGTDYDKGLSSRAELRKKRIVVNNAVGHDEAEAWDLAFWQACSPEDRLSALVAIRRDVEKVERVRNGINT